MDSKQKIFLNHPSIEPPNGSTGVFPSLIDGYIADFTNPRTEGKAHRIDLGASCYDPDDALIESTAIAAWALTLSKYIGVDHVSLYIVLNDRSQWRASICHMAIHEPQTKFQFLQQARLSLNDAKYRSTPFEKPTECGLSELSCQSVNTAIVFQNGVSNGSAPALDQILQVLTLCGLKYFSI